MQTFTEHVEGAVFNAQSEVVYCLFMETENSGQS